MQVVPVGSATFSFTADGKYVLGAQKATRIWAVLPIRASTQASVRNSLSNFFSLSKKEMYEFRKFKKGKFHP